MGNAISMNAYSYNNVVSGTGGKLYVPVKPSSVVYAQFDHISGVAAEANQDGISITKIQILNSLINQMVTMKHSPDAPTAANVPDGQVDALIEQYQVQLHNVMQTAQVSGYGLAGVMPEAGALFSVSV